MANPIGKNPGPAAFTSVEERQKFAVLFSPNSSSNLSANIQVDREPVKVVAFGLREGEQIEVLQLAGAQSGGSFETYRPYDRPLILDSTKSELVLSKSGRYRLQFTGEFGQMFCFDWAFSMTHDWANEVLVEGLRQLCICMEPPPFLLTAGLGISVAQIAELVWQVTNTGLLAAIDSVTIDHNVQALTRNLTSTVRVSAQDGNLLIVRPDGLFVSFLEMLTPCGIGSAVPMSTAPMPLRFLALDDSNCIVSVAAEDVGEWLCTTDCTPTAVLAVGLAIDPDFIYSGGLTLPSTALIDATISNAGPEEAVNVLVKLALPNRLAAGAPVIGPSPISILYSAGAFGPASRTAQQLRDGFFVNLRVGAQVRIYVTVSTEVAANYTVLLTAQLAPPYTDPETVYSAAETLLVIDSDSNLRVRKTVWAELSSASDRPALNAVPLNRAATFVVSVENLGAVISPPVLLTDTFAPFFGGAWSGTLRTSFPSPADFTPVAVANLPAGIMLPAIPRGGSVWITYQLAPVAVGPYNTMTVIATPSDPSFVDDPVDNTFALVGTVTPAIPPDFAITKVGQSLANPLAPPNLVALGGDMLFTVRVTNTSAISSTVDFITDNLALGYFAAPAAFPPGWTDQVRVRYSWTPSTPWAYFNLGDLAGASIAALLTVPAGGVVTIEYVLTAVSAGPYTNTVAVARGSLPAIFIDQPGNVI